MIRAEAFHTGIKKLEQLLFYKFKCLDDMKLERNSC